MARFCSTVRFGNTPWALSGTSAIPRRARAAAVLSVTSSPVKLIRPAAGRLSPASVRSSVDLPAPS